MQLTYLRLENFLGWSKLEIDLSTYTGVTLITGVNQNDYESSNGVGKSSLIKAITFALFGELPGISPDDLIHQGSTNMAISLEFIHNDKRYEIIRSRKLKGKKYSSFRCLTDKKTLNITPEEFFNLNIETWYNTNYSPQGDLDGFLKYPASKRKEILYSLFNLDKFEKWYDSSKKILNSISSKISEYKLTIDNLNNTKPEPINFDEISFIAKKNEVSQMEKDLQEYEKKVKEYDKLLTDKEMINKDIQYASGQISTLEKEAFNELIISISSIEKEITKLSGENIDENKLLEEKEQLEELIMLEKQKIGENEKNKQEILALSQNKYSNEREIKNINNEIEKMKKLGGICSACKQKVSEEHKLAEIKNLNDNKEKLNREIQELALQLSQKEKEGIEITNFINLINQSKVALSKIQYMIEKKKEKDKKIKELFANKEQLEKILQNKKIDIENRKKILLESLKESQSKFNTIIEKLAILKDVKQKYLDIEKRYNIANSELQQLIILKTRSEEVKNQINKIEIKVKDLEVQLNSLKEEEYLYIELTKALHYNGIPSLVLANWLEELQYLCNEYLSFFSDNRISLTFSLQKVNKSNNNVVDTLDVIVSDENGSRNIELYSGGEKTRIYLSIRLALLKLLTMKNFNNVNILIIDELSDLDQLGMKLFLEALKNLESYFSQIFFVTHITELTNEIKNNIILRKDITDEQKSC